MASESIWVNSLTLKGWYPRAREGKMLAQGHTAHERRTRSRTQLSDLPSYVFQLVMAVWQVAMV